MKQVGGEEPLDFRRGQILLEPVVEPVTCMEFEADVLLLFHHTKISRKFQCTVHIGNVLQTAIIKSISKESLSTGQRAKVVFKFVCHPEYIHVGDQILFREGRSKGIGEVTALIPYFEDDKTRTSNNSFSSSSDSDT
jgi:GTPase